MAYEIVENHDGCPDDMPVAVVNTDGPELVGCHANAQDAADQVRMLNEADQAESAAADPEPVALPRWRAMLVRLGEGTSDGRMFDAIDWRALPLSLMWQIENWAGHDGAVIVGQISEIVFDVDGRTVWAAGVFDVDGENGAEAYRLVKAGMLKGISIDAAITGDVYVDENAVQHFSGEILAATLVPTPAFANAAIELIDPVPAPEAGPPTVAAIEPVVGPEVPPVAAVRLTSETVDLGAGLALVASGRPVLPASAFARPPMPGREGVHIEEDGRVWGHIYGWGECHIGSPAGRCIQPPPSTTNYAYFLTGSVLTEEGEIAVGPIAISTDHAPLDLGWARARDHYAHTGLVAADVTCGEDEYGIWIAGMIRPGAAPEVLHAFHAAKKVSGDWRPIGRGLELMAILTVTVEGYPYRRLAAHVEAGRVTALVASAPMLADGDCGCGGGTAGMTPLLDDVLSRLSILETEREARHADDLAAQAAVIAAMDRELGLDAASILAAMDAELNVVDA